MTAYLIVNCTEYLETVRAFADETNQRAQFEAQLARLTDHLLDNSTVELYKDFAPFSFIFCEFGPYPIHQRGIYGGLIYHGSHDGGGNGGAPTFSVCLTPTTGWSIHT